MKKAAADLAPTLPVKNIIFLNKSAFYAVFHTTCTFPGMPPKGLRPPGYQFRGNQRKRGRRSPVPLVFRIMTSPPPRIILQKMIAFVSVG